MKAIRQGDCYLKPIDCVPKGATRKQGRTIALGEATGHHHTFAQESVQLWDHGGQTVIEVPETATLEHQEHNAVEVKKGTYLLIMEREVNHFTQVIEQVKD